MVSCYSPYFFIGTNYKTQKCFQPNICYKYQKCAFLHSPPNIRKTNSKQALPKIRRRSRVTKKEKGIIMRHGCSPNHKLTIATLDFPISLLFSMALFSSSSKNSRSFICFYKAFSGSKQERLCCLKRKIKNNCKFLNTHAIFIM